MFYLVKIKFYMVVAYRNKVGRFAFMASVVIDNFCVVLFSGLQPSPTFSVLSEKRYPVACTSVAVGTPSKEMSQAIFFLFIFCFICSG